MTTSVYEDILPHLDIDHPEHVRIKAGGRFDRVPVGARR